MNLPTNSGRSLLLVLLVAAALVGALAVGPAAVSATEHVDQWDGDESTNSDVADFDAEEDRYIEYQYDDPDGDTVDAAEVELAISYDGIDHEVVTLAAADSTRVDTDGDGTNDADRYTFNVSHDQLETVPGESGANTTVAVNVTEFEEDADGNIQETDEGEASAGDLVFATQRSVLFLADGTQAFADVDHDERDPAFFQIFTDSVPDHFVLDTERTVDGSNTTVTMFLDGDMASDYSDTAGEPEAGDLLVSMGALGDGEIVGVYYQEAGDDVDVDADTYMVYDDAADSLTMHLGDDYDGHTSIDVLTANHKATDFADVGILDFADAFGWTAAIGSLLATIGVAAVRREE